MIYNPLRCCLHSGEASIFRNSPSSRSEPAMLSCTNFSKFKHLQREDFGSYFSKIFPVFDTDLSQDSCQAQFFLSRGLQARSLRSRWLCLNRFGFTTCERWDCVDPPFGRGTSQGKYGSSTIDLVCVGETVGKIGEVDEMGERELVLVVSARCGKERDMTRSMTIVFGTQRCAILSLPAFEPRVFA